jgi:hypothetical protein
MTYVVVVFVYNGWRWDVVDCFVDIVGIFDHHCLKMFFIIKI